MTNMNYTIEQSDQEVTIRLSKAIPPQQLQDMLNYFRYIELGTNNEVEQAQIDALAEEVQQSWWRKNKERFKGVEGFEDIDV